MLFQRHSCNMLSLVYTVSSWLGMLGNRLLCICRTWVSSAKLTYVKWLGQMWLCCYSPELIPATDQMQVALGNKTCQLTWLRTRGPMTSWVIISVIQDILDYISLSKQKNRMTTGRKKISGMGATFLLPSHWVVTIFWKPSLPLFLHLCKEKQYLSKQSAEVKWGSFCSIHLDKCSSIFQLWLNSCCFICLALSMGCFFFVFVFVIVIFFSFILILFAAQSHYLRWSVTQVD